MTDLGFNTTLSSVANNIQTNQNLTHDNSTLSNYIVKAFNITSDLAISTIKNITSSLTAKETINNHSTTNQNYVNHTTSTDKIISTENIEKNKVVFIILGALGVFFLLIIAASIYKRKKNENSTKNNQHYNVVPTKISQAQQTEQKISDNTV